MAIYSIDGNTLSAIYDVSGNLLEQAYDISGNPLLQPPKLVVMTYNVQWFSSLNSNGEMQQKIIDTYNPQIIGLQELHNPLGSVGTSVLSNYPYFAFGNQENLSGIASKIPLRNVTAALFEHQEVENKGYQTATFSFNGKEIFWVNAHLQVSQYESTKVAQAEELFDLVQNKPYFIITGDFNTVCKSTNDPEYATIMKQFVDAGYNCANCSPQHGFIDTWTSGSTASGTWYPCDHIITSSSITMDQVVADQSKIAVAAQTGQSIDHIPLIAKLTIN